MTDFDTFVSTVKNYYVDYGRHDMPWRASTADGTFDPYHIWVSEIMLQQTQVTRVIPKYLAFIQAFPTVYDLAQASLSSVLQHWIGLGYNRRAKYLLEAAQLVVSRYGGVVPSSMEELITLPGIGKNTAGAIMVYAYNEPVVFIETNIRSVYIHHFFADRTAVDDAELLPLIASTLDKENPREWYWALMDYGAYSKATFGNASRQSKHHTKQSTFVGSKRQLRGAIVRQLARKPQSLQSLLKDFADVRLEQVLEDLTREGLIQVAKQTYSLVE